MEKAKVYFTKEITPESLIKMYEVLNHELGGKVAVKLHSGEDGNQNYLRPDFMKALVEKVNGTVVECNTAYPGARTNNEDHRKLLHKHEWDKYYNVDLMDEDGEIELEVKNGKVLKHNYVGSHIKDYDSMLVLSHFKGHPMGGFGGAIKQLSIGCASRKGKAFIHGAGTTHDAETVWNNLPKQEEFLESMADAASSVVELFKGNIVYINVMKNMSVDCDCCADAEDPCIKDIGILSSLDPIAIDQACIDLVYASEDKGKFHLLERINSRNGLHTLEAAHELGFGNRNYELINVDEKE